TGPQDARTMAELSPAEKHAISHRGRAARLLAEHLGLKGAEAARMLARHLGLEAGASR
ncbi:MAG TPA: non-canonical purine NTP pyrophosphatase, partial [Solirubrobacterales bacterium]|nr:non-canonical purine NTP pyrophosphatase [Solirubrobacterales bacterium]